jgi:hypothetical protein
MLAMPYESKVLVVALVGDSGTPIEGAETDPAVTLKGVVALIGILHGW